AILYGHFELLADPDPAVMHLYFFGASGATWFFAGMFGRLFLNTKTYAPVCDKILLVIIFMSFVVAGTAFSGQTYLAHKINAFLGMTCPPMAIFSALRVWRKGFAPAKYFFGAWLILVTGIILYSMGGTLIPRTPVTIYTFAFGAGIEAILLSLALADRIRLLQKEKDELRRSERRFRKEAITDEMTGLFNRRYLLETLGREIRRAQTDQNPLSLLILDVDNFKQFNDTFGHPEGDKVLKALAEVLFQQVREKDSPCRYGGEEFVVVLPHTGRSAALGVAERIRESFAAHVFQPDADGTGSQNITVTVSIGLAELRVGENGQEFIRRADKALYSAKTQGKNRVVCD
ncbi:MAG: GGDEF domain-containing protein, partial [Desulfobacterales bacterium]|nr:GGDEF domain-containing protein [Desulfobacterales bacterium]